MAFGLKVATACLMVFGTAAQAQQTCLQRDIIVERLDTRYDEKPAGRGLLGDARLFEVFVSTDGETWTIVQSFPSGMACVMAAGTHWYQTDYTALAGVEG